MTDTSSSSWALITGGAGFLGYHLSRFLHEKGFRVRILDRASFHADEYPQGTEFIQGDVRDSHVVTQTMKGVRFVVHAAAALPLCPKKEIFSVNIDGTRNVLHAALEEKVERVVFISSTAVYGVPKEHPLYEHFQLQGVGPYGETKIQAEALCEEFRSKGLYVSIIRPKTFIGEARLGVFSILYDWVLSGKRIPMIGNGENRYQLLEVEDLCSAIYLTLTHPGDSANDVFNVGASEFKTVREDLQVLADFARTGSRPVGFPAFLVKFCLSMLESMKLSPLYKWVYGTADTDSFVSTEKIQERLGWSPKYSNAQALIRSYRWFLDHKDAVQGGAEGVTHTVAWKQGALKWIKKLF